jgi:hypothetical protein
MWALNKTDKQKMTRRLSQKFLMRIDDVCLLTIGFYFLFIVIQKRNDIFSLKLTLNKKSQAKKDDIKHQNKL